MKSTKDELKRLFGTKIAIILGSATIAVIAFLIWIRIQIEVFAHG